MDLRKATELVIQDTLENHQGGIAFEDLENMSAKERKELAVKLVNSDEFLERLTATLEDVINEYFEEFGEEYDIYG
ncbi:hypothetical protein [Parageobacillus galactosidasius]|jgi:hypothetical protein|uniref:Uncharacterized protein n=1 Tax=Parageobacillus galactosidasius TaxID=883812 RepID=A0A226QTW1_9BACL|nr:hypothetical protein [Parageobacillus galactosidasius]OXB94859.1 hypothetical protein B9L23_08330 [Parageobacillus galactosidasius]